MEVSTTRGLRRRRVSAGLSQNELAARVGVSYQAVGKWERGDGYPAAALLPLLANALSCTIDDLYREEDEPDGQGQQAPPAC